MRKYVPVLFVTVLLMLVLLPAGAFAEAENVAINSTNFPDAVFRDYVSENFDTNKDNILSPAEYSSVNYIDVKSKGMTSLKGIENFYNLKTLICSGNSITTLDLSELRYLQVLNCVGNKLTTLDLPEKPYDNSYHRLQELYCDNNSLGRLSLTNCSDLKKLYCSGNELRGLDVSSCESLEELYCSGNHIKFLSLDKNTELQTLVANQSFPVEYAYGSGDKRDVYEIDGFGLSYVYTNSSDRFSVLEGGTISSDGVISCPGTKFRYAFDTGAPCSGSTMAVTLYKRVPVNEKVFPDDDFRDYVSQEFDADNDGYLIGDEIESITDLDLAEEDFADIKGIEHFCYLASLDCSDNYLTSLDVSRNTNLTELNCSLNFIENLDLSINAGLETLDCSVNSLTSLDISHNTNLTSVNCDKNALTSLTIGTNSKLTELECRTNLLSSLDVSKAVNLDGLFCTGNELKTLDVASNTKLRSLQCANNELTELDLSRNLRLVGLACNGNSLAYLDLSNNTRIDSGRSAISPQHIEVSMTGLDLSDYMPRSSIANVTPGGEAFLMDGTVFCTDPTFVYTYNTGNSSVGQMTVNMHSAKYDFGTWKMERDGSNSISVTVDRSGQYCLIFMHYESGRISTVKMKTVSLKKGTARNFIGAPFKLQSGDKVLLIDADNTPVTTALPI